MKRIRTVLAAALLVAGCGVEEADRELEQAAPADGAVDVAQEAQRVQVGMTEAEVIEILGEPRTRVGEEVGERLTFWNFDAQQRVQSRVYVTLDADGKVVNVETL